MAGGVPVALSFFHTTAIGVGCVDLMAWPVQVLYSKFGIINMNVFDNTCTTCSPIIFDFIT